MGIFLRVYRIQRLHIRTRLIVSLLLSAKRARVRILTKTIAVVTDSSPSLIELAGDNGIAELVFGDLEPLKVTG